MDWWGGGLLPAARILPFFFASGNPVEFPGHFSDATSGARHPGIVVCEMHSVTAFGLASMVFTQASAGLESVFVPAYRFA